MQVLSGCLSRPEGAASDPDDAVRQAAEEALTRPGRFR